MRDEKMEQIERAFQAAIDRFIAQHAQRPVMAVEDALDNFSILEPPVAGLYTVHVRGQPHWSHAAESLRDALERLPQQAGVQYSPLPMEVAVPVAYVMNERICI